MTSTIKPPTDAELLPCPFCGNQPEPSGYYAVICMGCGVSGPSGGNFEEACVAWNRRAPSPAGEPVAHKPGCPALGGYGHGIEPCCCGAEPYAQPEAVRDPLTESEMAEGWRKFQEQLELRMAADPGGLRSMGRDHWLSWAHWKAACFFARGITQKEGGRHAE